MIGSHGLARCRWRRPGLAPLTVAVLLLAAACSSATPTTASSVEGPASSTTTSQPAPSAFPVTIDHVFGSTTIAAEPQRVVTIGFSDHDTVLALGVVPVAIRDWYGDYEYVWPWAEEALGDATPVVLDSAELNFEQIATLQPDLILGLYIGLESDEYETLSQIAPTVAQSGDYLSFGTPWQEMTRTAGRALGRSDRAEEAIAETEALFAASRAAHPEFAGVGLAYAGVYQGNKHYVETEGSTRVAHLLELGFVVPPELAALGSDKFFYDLSPEQLGLLDQDVVLWELFDASSLPAVTDNAIYQNLSVAQEGRDIFVVDPVLVGAMSHSTVLSLPILLADLVPKLAEAVAKPRR